MRSLGGPAGALAGQGSRSQGHTGERFGGTGIWATRKGSGPFPGWPSGGRRAAQMLEAAQGGSSPAREGAQMVTFLAGSAQSCRRTGMLSTAVQISRPPGSPGNPPERKRWCRSPHLTPPGASFLPTLVSAPCVRTCGGQGGPCPGSSAWLAFEERPEEEGPSAACH